MTDMIDWSTEYDIFHPDYIADPFTIWDDLRSRCPVAHTDVLGGSWLPTTYEDVTAIARDIEHFSSKSITVFPPLNPDQEPITIAAPISVDPPLHTYSRRTLLPSFSPKAVDQLEVFTRAWCRELMDGIAGRDTADAAVEYAQLIPAQVIAVMLGVPTNMKDKFTEWVRAVLENATYDLEGRQRASDELREFFISQLAERRAKGLGDDMISELLRARDPEGNPYPDRLVLGMCGLLLIAGVDTTWSGIGSSLWHLATHKEDRERLLREPELIDSAVEEFLRFYSPVTMARVLHDDYEYKGCPMHKGDRVLMAFPAANRDPEAFEDADKFIIDREHNRHVAFGAGIHRCAGSNLARMEMKVAIEEFLARVPHFELDGSKEVTWAGGQVRGPRNIPIKVLESNPK
ncbi:MAG: cytochrome P450 [Acidimicrobiales bacterium]